MNDTSSEITKKMCEMIQAKSPIERVKMGCSMYETSKRLVIQSILRNNPFLSTAELRQEILLKFYGRDLEPAILNKILKHFQNLD
jgi:hypothetical protein